MESTVLRGTDISAYDRVVRALRTELGDDAVLTAPHLTVAPRSAEEVRAAVRIAGAHRVGVDPRRMNRVLDVDPLRARAVVEPGTRWSDLYEALARTGGDLWIPVPDLGWDGVIGDGLAPGVGYSRDREHLAGLCGTHRTSGVVTGISWRLARRPEVYTECRAGFTGPRALSRVLDALRDPRLRRTVDGPVVLTRGFDFDENGVGGVDPDGDGWVARFRMCGTATAVDAGYAKAAEILLRAAGVRLSRRTFEGDDVAEAARLDERLRGAVPDMDLREPAVLPHGEGTAHLDFTPLGPGSGATTARADEVARARCARHGRTCVSTVVIRPRGTHHHITTVFFNPRDERQVRSVHDCYAGLVEELAVGGHAPYRTNVRGADLVGPLPRHVC